MLSLLSFADVITLINVIFGFLAIIMIIRGELRFAFSFILLALLADGLDGIVARRIKKSKLGSYMEAMGDMTSMGIAPAIFVFVIYYDLCCLHYQILLIAILIFYLAMGVIRLASFPSMENRVYFLGLPVPASTIIILISAYFEIDFVYILLIILVVSIVNVSNIRFPKPSILINSIATVLIFMCIIFEKSFYGLAPLLLLLAISLYVIGSPIYYYFSKNK
jgi:CDP-diacylglycerol--serine O-phosphatidyltransferase